MTLYLYRHGTAVPVLTIESVQSYTADGVTALDENGELHTYAPLAEDCELSSKEDCSETLRAKWRAEHPDTEAQMAALAEENKRLKAKLDMHAQNLTFLEDCLLEMGDVVYA